MSLFRNLLGKAKSGQTSSYFEEESPPSPDGRTSIAFSTSDTSSISSAVSSIHRFVSRFRLRTSSGVEISNTPAENAGSKAQRRKSTNSALTLSSWKRNPRVTQETSYPSPLQTPSLLSTPDLVERSQFFAPLAPPSEPGDSRPTSPDVPPPNPTPPLSPSQEDLRRSIELNALEAEIKRLNTGAVTITSSHAGHSYMHSVSLTGREHDDFVHRDSINIGHIAFLGMYADKIPGIERLKEYDIEVSENFEGRIPGTVTVEGLGWERWDEAEKKWPRRQSVYFSMHALPPVSGRDILRRLEITKMGLRFSSPQHDEFALYKLIGRPHSAFDPENPYQGQIWDLLRVLNREDIFEDFTSIGSVYLLAVAPPPDGMGIRNFLFQILLGYELLVRLEMCKGGTYPSLTHQVSSNVIMSRRWGNNVETSLQGNEVKFYSLVHDTQVDGLLRFAESMQWPSLVEAREFAENAWSAYLDGEKIDVHCCDWLFGTVLPGRLFACKIMTTLVYCTPSIRHFGFAPFLDSGLMLQEATYWRSRTVLARVLGGLRVTKGLVGWVGPCPKAVSDSGDAMEGWIRIEAKHVPFKRPSCPEERTEDEIDITDINNSSHSIAREDPLREMVDPMNWSAPPVPPRSIDSATLEQLTLKSLPLHSDEDESCRTAEASLTFQLNCVPVTYRLVHNPVFVAAHPCIGTHLVHDRDLPRHKENIVEVRNLKSVKDSAGVLVINATGKGTEVVARAFCAERGKHAIVRRGNGTCFACAYHMAESLAVDVLIWA